MVYRVASTEKRSLPPGYRLFRMDHTLPPH
jgi:hypothetical protein